MKEWISVEERLPDRDCELIIFSECSVDEVSIGAFSDGEFYTPESYLHYACLGEDIEITEAINVTYWMYLPDSPNLFKRE